MLVAVDIGNTNIVLGFLDGDTIAGTYRITTKANHTSDEYGLFLTEFLRMSGFQPSDVDDVIICSVVPKVMHSFRSSIVKFLDIDPMVVGPGIKTGMNVRVDDPKSLGADILADCAGAYYEYGGPVLVADFGTATTFTHVSDKGVVDSGVITTGIRAGAAALWGDTAQLPEVEITRPETILGTNTKTCMQDLIRSEERRVGRPVLHVPGRRGTHNQPVPQGAWRRGLQGDHHRRPWARVRL